MLLFLYRYALEIITIFLSIFSNAYSGLKRPETNQRAGGPENANTILKPQTVTLPQTFPALKIEAERLVTINKSDYEDIKLSDFDAVMKPLKEIPASSKDYRAAQSL